MCGSSLAPQRPNVGSPWVSDVQNPLTNRLSQVLTALNPDFHASAIFSHVSSPLWMVNRQNFQVTGRRRRRARAEFEKARRSTKAGPRNRVNHGFQPAEMVKDGAFTSKHDERCWFHDVKNG